MIHWDTCKEDFRQDGSLRDIYIIPATLADWQALYPLLCDYPGVDYSVDGVTQPPPATVEEIFAARSSSSPMLSLRIGGAFVIFHFFSTDEIECDVNPRQITSQADLDAMLGFVQQMGDGIGKPVLLTPENCREQPFIRYTPGKGFAYHPITS